MTCRWHAALWCVAVLSALGSDAICAQTGAPLPSPGPLIERHPPLQPVPRPQTLPAPTLPPASQDFRPLGVNLAGIRLLGPDDALMANPAAPGIVIEHVGAMAHPALTNALAPFLGRPLSRGLMSEIQEAVVEAYRAAGYPFLTAVYPPQEISHGVVQLRVVEFRAGTVQVEGVPAAAQQRVRDGIRLQTGGRINSTELSEDLRWLNLFPYHFIQGFFTPGSGFGTTDLILRDTRSRPWQVFGGVSNEGAPSSGRFRDFLGFGAGFRELHDLFLSYQLTTSSDFWGRPDPFPSGPGRPRYISQSAVFDLPLASRQSLEFAPAYVAIQQQAEGGLFAFNSNVIDLPVLYRFALSNLFPGFYGGDLLIGIEPKVETRTTWFGGADAGNGSVDALDLVLGWQKIERDRLGHTSFDLRITGNPGGVIGGNNDASWSSFTNGRVDSSRYVFGSLDIARLTTLPHHLAWKLHVVANVADTPLPDLDQFALGGAGLVRGYTYDDGVVDTGIVIRNALMLPQWAPLEETRMVDLPDTLSPYLFIDYGAGRAIGSALSPGQTEQLASLGAGFDYQLGRFAHLGLDAAYGLENAADLHAGGWHVDTELTLSY